MILGRRVGGAGRVIGDKSEDDSLLRIGEFRFVRVCVNRSGSVCVSSSILIADVVDFCYRSTLRSGIDFPDNLLRLYLPNRYTATDEPP